MRLILAPRAPRSVLLSHPPRCRAPLLYPGQRDESQLSKAPSKCPFFGGPNGGGIGDANIVTYALFVLVVLALRQAIIRISPQRMLVAIIGALKSLGTLVTGSVTATSVMGAAGRVLP